MGQVSQRHTCSHWNVQSQHAGVAQGDDAAVTLNMINFIIFELVANEIARGVPGGAGQSRNGVHVVVREGREWVKTISKNLQIQPEGWPP
jgi:hypothetical protein